MRNSSLFFVGGNGDVVAELGMPLEQIDIEVFYGNYAGLTMRGSFLVE